MHKLCDLCTKSLGCVPLSELISMSIIVLYNNHSIWSFKIYIIYANYMHDLWNIRINYIICVLCWTTIKICIWILYSGLPNESTALMRVLVDKKSKNAKSTGLQNVPNESTGWQKMQSLPVWICSRKILNWTFSRKTYGTPYVGRYVIMEWNTLCRWVYHCGTLYIGGYVIMKHPM